jgi:CubicO group peptidase (beta-lactamase class C family)
MTPPIASVSEWMRRFATLPLMHQPGARWMYNTSLEVLSVLVARAAGRPLDVFLEERVFQPLGMKDTSFGVPEAKLDRLATSYIARDPLHPDAGGFPLYPRLRRRTSGRYGWDEGLGASWCSDPARGLVGILMSQRAAFPPMAGVSRDFWKTAYRAEGCAP